MRNKNKIKSNTFPPRFVQVQLHSCIPASASSHLKWQREKWGSENWNQFLTVALFRYFLLSFFPCSCVGFLQDAVLQEIFTSSGMTLWLYASMYCTAYRKIPVPAPAAPPPTPPLTLVFIMPFLTSFLPLSSIFFTIFKVVFLKYPHLGCWAHSCPSLLDLMGISSAQHVAAPASPHREPCSPLLLKICCLPII